MRKRGRGLQTSAFAELRHRGRYIRHRGKPSAAPQTRKVCLSAKCAGRRKNRESLAGPRVVQGQRWRGAPARGCAGAVVSWVEDWVCEEETCKVAAMRASSERTDTFLRDGGVARAGPVLSGLRPSSAMAVWPGNPRESAGAGPDCADCSSLGGNLCFPNLIMFPRAMVTQVPGTCLAPGRW